MKLAKLLEGVQVTKLFQTVYGQMVVTQDITISSLEYDSRKVGVNSCFVALKGTTSDGHMFVHDAIANGAKAIVLEDEAVLPDALCMHTGVVKIVVPNSRKALARMSANFYNHSATRLTIVGITGTNGKTSTSVLMKTILEEGGKRCGLIGTIEYHIGQKVIPASHTTPESLELHQLFAAMEHEGCAAVSMEVSSHSLDQERVDGIPFAAGIFTNLTQDHLDYHKTMDNYFLAKKKLFDALQPSSVAVTNVDDTYGTLIISDTTAIVVRYGFKSPADVAGKILQMNLEGTEIEIKHNKECFTVFTHLLGGFNAYNVLSAVAAGLALGISPDTLQKAIAKVKNVKGRFERYQSSKGWTAIIDYAHTPDALEKCLRAINEVMPKQKRGKIITVFGAGGDRDKTKRPLMGIVASQLSDVVVVTSDNPRTEQPEAIIEDIVKGISGNNSVVKISDRKQAIIHALSTASSGDIVLIAGKGHEEYQIIGNERIHFSDREVVEQVL